MNPHAPIDPELERRIVRMLDGQLDEAQKARLYRQVLRNPLAHRILSDYSANDELAADALHSLLDGPAAPPSPRLHRKVGPAGGGGPAAAVPQSRRRHASARRWGLAAAAVAAAVAVLVGGSLIVAELSSRSTAPPPSAGVGGAADGIAINGAEDEPVEARPSRQQDGRREGAGLHSPAVEPAAARGQPDTRPVGAPATGHSAGRGFVGIVDPHSDTIIYIQVDGGDAGGEGYADF